MRRTVAVPYVVREVDYRALREAIEQAFQEEYSPERVRHVRVAHLNPAMIDVTVTVQDRTPEMSELAVALSEAFRQQGVRVAIRVTEIDTAPEF
jgi:hypothetical protein